MSKIAVFLCSELLVFLSSGAFWPRDEKSISGVICVALTGKEILVRPDYTPRSTEPPPVRISKPPRQIAKRVYTMAGNRSEDALVRLSELLSHSSTAITRKYIGLTQQVMADTYDMLAY